MTLRTDNASVLSTTLWSAISSYSFYAVMLCIVSIGGHAQELPQPITSIHSPMDSVRKLRVEIFNGDSVISPLQLKKDSLLINGSNKLIAVNMRVDSVRQTLQSKLDSLTKLPRPDSLVQKRYSQLLMQTDSLSREVSLLKNKLEPAEVKKIEESANRLTQKTTNFMNEKLALLQGNGFSESVSLPKVPALAVPSVQIPGITLPQKPNVPDVGQNVSIPGLDQTSLPKTDLPGADIGSILPSNDLHLNSYTGKVDEVSNQATGYQEEVKSLTTGKLDEVKTLPANLEEKITSLNEVEELKKEVDAVEKVKGFYDPEVAKEEAVTKAKTEVINHFAGHEKELEAAMKKVSELKSKFPNTEGVLDLFAHKQRFLSGRPFIEHFVPGFTFQFQKRQSFWLDLNPLLGYRISPKFTSGIGWNERIAYDFDEMDWDKRNHIYGPRSFINFKFRPNFWLKAEAETMNAFIRTSLQDEHAGKRLWVWNYFAGIKTDFTLSKKLKGNTQLLYSLYNPNHRNIYADRISIRLGLEFPIIRKEN